MVTNQGVVEYSNRQINALVNLSGAYLARYKDHKLHKKQVIWLIDNILKDDPAGYKVLNELLAPDKILTEMTLPPGQWTGRGK
jgi:hypothetical protein